MKNLPQPFKATTVHCIDKIRVSLSIVSQELGSKIICHDEIFVDSRIKISNESQSEASVSLQKVFYMLYNRTFDREQSSGTVDSSLFFKLV